MFNFTPYVPENDEAKELVEYWSEECERLAASRVALAENPSLLGSATLATEESELMFQALVAAALQIEGWQDIVAQTVEACGEESIDEIVKAMNQIEEQLDGTDPNMEQQLLQALADGDELTQEQLEYAAMIMGAVDVAAGFDGDADV